MIRASFLLSLLLVAFCLTNAQVVLVVHSGYQSGDASQYEAGFDAGLQKSGVFTEDNEDLFQKSFFLQNDIFSGEELLTRASEALALITSFDPDVVLISENDAFNLVAIPYLEANPATKTIFLFAGVTIDVFSAYPEYFPARLEPPAANLNGFYPDLQTELQGQLDLIVDTVPALKTIVWLGDDLAETQARRAQFESLVAAHELTIALNITTVTTEAELLNAVEAANNKTGVSALNTILMIDLIEGLDPSHSLFQQVVELNSLSEIVASKYSIEVKHGMMMAYGLNHYALASDVGFLAAELLLGTTDLNSPLRLNDFYVGSFHWNRFKDTQGSYLHIPQEYLIRSRTTYFSPPAPPNGEAYKVLMVHSYEDFNSATAQMESGFVTGLEQLGFNQDTNLELRSVYMDTKTINTAAEDIQAAAEHILDLIAAWQPDLVYTTDDNALKFVSLEYCARYPDTETDFVFVGINVDVTIAYSDVFPSHDPPYSVPITGMYERFNYAEMYKFILTVKPTTTNVLWIVDDNPIGAFVTNDYNNWLAANPDQALTQSPDDMYTVTTVEDFKDVISRYQHPRENWFLMCLTIAAVETPDGVGVGINTPVALDLWKWFQTNSLIGELFQSPLVPLGFLGTVGNQDFITAGKGAALMAAKCLANETTAKDLKMNDPVALSTLLNLERASQLEPYGIHVPQSYISEALEISFDTQYVAVEPITDYQISSGGSVAFRAIAGIELALFMFSGFLLVWWRGEAWIASASVPFMCVILLGLSMVVVTPFILGVEPTNAGCVSAPFLAHTGFVMLIGALCLKTYRLMRIFIGGYTSKRSNNIKVVKVTNAYLAVRLAAMVALTILYLAIWFIVDTPTVVEIYDESLNQYALECQSDSNLWALLILAPEAMLLLWAVQLCVVIRNLPRAFNEASYIATSLYSMALFAFFVVPVVIISDDRSVTYFMQNVGILFLAGVTWVAMFGSKFYAVFAKKAFTGTMTNSAISSSKPSYMPTSKYRSPKSADSRSTRPSANVDEI